MNITNINNELKSVIDPLAERVSTLGLKTQIEIEATDDDGECCAIESESAVEVMGTLYVGTEDMADEDMVGHFMLLQIGKNGYISDKHFYEEAQRFTEDVESFIERLNMAEDRVAFIKEEAENANKETEAALAQFEKSINRIEKIGKFAVISLIAVAIVLVIIGIVL